MAMVFVALRRPLNLGVGPRGVQREIAALFARGGTQVGVRKRLSMQTPRAVRRDLPNNGVNSDAIRRGGFGGHALALLSRRLARVMLAVRRLGKLMLGYLHESNIN